jgi:hypothetical protein
MHIFEALLDQIIRIVSICVSDIRIEIGRPDQFIGYFHEVVQYEHDLFVIVSCFR